MSEFIEFKVEGIKELEAMLSGISVDVNKRVRGVLNRSAKKIKEDIIASLDTISHGATYLRPGGRKHVASKAGDAPNNDFGELKKKIKITQGTKFINKGYEVTIESGAKYSRGLEEGTNKVEPRPFMEPAFKKNEKAMKKSLNRAMRNAVKAYN